jgi:alkyl hydroperoxide reductase subunit F
MLDANLKSQLQSYFERIQLPLELVASLDDSAKSQEMKELLEDIAPLSDKITLRLDGVDARKPLAGIRVL